MILREWTGPLPTCVSRESHGEVPNVDEKRLDQGHHSPLPRSVPLSKPGLVHQESTDDSAFWLLRPSSTASLVETYRVCKVPLVSPDSTFCRST
jgi:hypothetical protein